LRLQEHTKDDVVVIDVDSREPDATGPRALTAKIRAVLEHGHRFILLNVADLTYVDSVWLGAIAQSYASSIRQGGALKLVHVSRRFRDLLRVTKLDTIIEGFESEDAATASFGTRRDSSQR
jgi:anti-sigma B factor antagonist